MKQKKARRQQKNSPQDYLIKFVGESNWLGFEEIKAKIDDIRSEKIEHFYERGKSVCEFTIFMKDSNNNNVSFEDAKITDEWSIPQLILIKKLTPFPFSNIFYNNEEKMFYKDNTRAEKLVLVLHAEIIHSNNMRNLFLIFLRLLQNEYKLLAAQREKTSSLKERSIKQNYKEQSIDQGFSKIYALVELLERMKTKVPKHILDFIDKEQGVV